MKHRQMLLSSSWQDIHLLPVYYKKSLKSSNIADFCILVHNLFRPQTRTVVTLLPTFV
jgi:hypothetical protein